MCRQQFWVRPLTLTLWSATTASHICDQICEKGPYPAFWMLMFLRGVFLQLYAQLKLKHGWFMGETLLQQRCRNEVFRIYHRNVDVKLKSLDCTIRKLWSRDHGIWSRRIKNSASQERRELQMGHGPFAILVIFLFQMSGATPWCESIHSLSTANEWASSAARPRQDCGQDGWDS